ncbi:MAG: RHS repeat-associated core domain-containing protein [Pseudomonadales bacterium]|nr:RHS repeat-associated core domain-containing protein [Pseudomonadales bacterium]MBH2077919.1 RHS repeat-associated core domain-containing protein [Pseudomonadales bacterium]
MTAQRETLLCRYQYDPLDQVVNCAPLNQDAVQRFYRKNRLATEIQGPVRYSMFEHESQLMAQQQQQREAGRVDSALLATDLQRSVLHAVAVDEHQRPVYAPYGHRSPENGLSSLLGFNGERRDPVTGHYLLGNGYRAFNPVLMRFNSPDSLSPFGKGGVNAYAYCAGDPVNRVDPNGHFFAPALVTGLSHGGLLPRVFSVVDAVISVPLGAAGVANRGFQRGVTAINNLRPSVRAAKAAETAYIQKAKSWDEYHVQATKFQAALADSRAAHAEVSNFKGLRNLNDARRTPTPEFQPLLDKVKSVEATLTKQNTRMQAAIARKDQAIQNWLHTREISSDDVVNSVRNLRR